MILINLVPITLNRSHLGFQSPTHVEIGWKWGMGIHMRSWSLLVGHESYMFPIYASMVLYSKRGF